MTVTMALSAIVTIPMASRYSMAKVQQVASAKGGPDPGAIMQTAIFPSLAALFASGLLGTLAGFIASRLLPPAEPSSRKSRRR